MAGFSVSLKVAGWCRVFHQFTEYLMIGMFTVPTIASTAVALAAVSRLLIACPRAMTPKYRNSRISMEVRRASQTRSEEHTSELQSRPHLVCRLLLEKKKRHGVVTCARL